MEKQKGRKERILESEASYSQKSKLLLQKHALSQPHPSLSSSFLMASWPPCPPTSLGFENFPIKPPGFLV